MADMGNDPSVPFEDGGESDLTLAFVQVFETTVAVNSAKLVKDAELPQEVVIRAIMMASASFAASFWLGSSVISGVGPEDTEKALHHAISRFYKLAASQPIKTVTPDQPQD